MATIRFETGEVVEIGCPTVIDEDLCTVARMPSRINGDEVTSEEAYAFLEVMKSWSSPI